MTKIKKKSPAKETLADIEIEEDIVVNKTPRNANLRESTTRPTEWRPPNNLEAPPAPDGYKHRWLRASARGYEENLFEPTNILTGTSQLKKMGNMQVLLELVAYCLLVFHWKL
jgi:hypothetical protein